MCLQEVQSGEHGSGGQPRRYEHSRACFARCKEDDKSPEIPGEFMSVSLSVDIDRVKCLTSKLPLSGEYCLVSPGRSVATIGEGGNDLRNRLYASTPSSYRLKTASNDVGPDRSKASSFAGANAENAPIPEPLLERR